MDKPQKWLPIAFLIAFVIALLLLSGGERRSSADPSLSYTRFMELVRTGEVLDVTLNGDRVSGHLRREMPLGATGRTTDRFVTRVPSFGDNALIPTLEKHGVTLSVESHTDEGTGRLVYGVLPWLVFLGIYIWLWRSMYRNFAGGMGGGRGDFRKFLEGTTTVEAKSGPRVTFADVAGQENAKREVAELVDYLRDPERYTRLGAEVPHGVLLIGPPGTGKTLLARALAGEAGVPFFSISASEFIEVFVGVGASRVRKMFDEAKGRAPAIIFIDELDSIGRVRGAGLGGGHDEREQTLNQILAEMDGFAGHEAVIVLAATNRPDVLDPALLRPGRFDRHVTLDLPDRDARLAILKVHARKVPLAADVDLAKVAAGTPGFSGAELKNLVNEAAMAAAREGRDRVLDRHFEEMRDRIMIGAVRSLAIHPEEHHRLAVHEAGHVVAAHFLPHTDPLHKVTIIPRGLALGATQMLAEEERHTLPEEYLKDQIAVMLGGRTSERILLGSVSSGADDDIRRATALARAMVARWGMSDAIGPVDLRESDEHPFLGREMAQPRRFSESTASHVDEAVKAIIQDAEQRVAAIIQGHWEGLNRLVAMLEERETLDLAEIESCLGRSVSPSGDTSAARRFRNTSHNKPKSPPEANGNRRVRSA